MIARVLTQISNMNIDKTFDYIVPSNLESKVLIGVRVKVPFNNRILEGFVLEISSDINSCFELKEIIDVVDSEPILNEELLSLGRFMSKKYFSTLISCYQTMLPKALKAQNKTNIGKRFKKYIRLKTIVFDRKLNKKQQDIVDYLRKNGTVALENLNMFSKASIKTLENNKIIEVIEKEHFRLKTTIEDKYESLILTEEQKNAKNIILSSKNNDVFLLHGVTGSGKTLLYLEIVSEMIKQNKDSIFLVPEISLTPQMVRQFKLKFGDLVAVLHSSLSEGEKYDEYRKIKSGKVKIVVGARSAVFAPFKNIGAIIIDEEHTNTYKQDNNPKYNAIDIAIERSKYHNSKVILGSATPSLDSYSRAVKGVYKLIELKTRANKKALPEVQLIDMNNEYKKNGMFSKKLIDELLNVIKYGEQAIILLNRRGYSSFITCSNCGYAVKCPNCDITLTYHKSSNTLRCHYCGYGERKLEICPNCKEKSMKNLGIGTEKLEEEIKRITNARVVRMDLDTTTKKGSHEKIVENFKNGEYDILLGTQMITKGLDFPNVTLVAIINADTSLMIPNYKSSEYTFQLLTQTAGRSGRGKKEGKVIIQTFNPEHYAISLAKKHDYISFFKEEMNIRRKLSYPPYYYLIYIKIIGKDYDVLSSESNKIGNKIKNKLSNSIILGPTTCSIFKLNGVYRFGIVIKYKNEPNLNKTLDELIEHYKNNQKIRIDIDINPNNFWQNPKNVV